MRLFTKAFHLLTGVNQASHSHRGPGSSDTELTVQGERFEVEKGTDSNSVTPAVIEVVGRGVARAQRKLPICSGGTGVEKLQRGNEELAGLKKIQRGKKFQKPEQQMQRH